MSYRIEYDGTVEKYEVRKVHPWRSPALCAVAILLLTAICVPNSHSREVLRSFLIPGEDAVTVLAFQTMTDDLRSGAALGEAFRDFCQVVIHGA